MAASSGCTNAYYQRFQIGQSPEAYDRILPAANMRRTDLGLCFLNRDALGGRTDAMVVLVTPDRRVAAKFQAVHTERRVPGLVSESGYRLVGEIDPQLCDVLATGPIDALRLITSRIVAYQGERLALDAHAWVAGGLVRLLDAWPTVRALPADDRRVSELLERVPGGGEAAIRIDARGRWTVTYEQGVMR